MPLCPYPAYTEGVQLLFCKLNKTCFMSLHKLFCRLIKNQSRYKFKSRLVWVFSQLKIILQLCCGENALEQTHSFPYCS